MQSTSTTFGPSHLVIETGAPRPQSTTIVERKGLGHPDTLADHLAERLSQVYSQYTFEHFGAILHHNFDKLALLGGASEVRYGAGKMTSPVRVLINGRAAASCGGEEIPVEMLVESAVHAFFAERLPEAAGHLDLRFHITANSSPGAVLTDGAEAERTRWLPLGRSRICASAGYCWPTTHRSAPVGPRRTPSSRSYGNSSTTSPAPARSLLPIRGVAAT